MGKSGLSLKTVDEYSMFSIQPPGFKTLRACLKMKSQSTTDSFRHCMCTKSTELSRKDQPLGCVKLIIWASEVSEHVVNERLRAQRLGDRAKLDEDRTPSSPCWVAFSLSSCRRIG